MSDSEDNTAPLTSGQDDDVLEPELRPAKIDDVPAIVALLKANLLFQLDNDFEANLKKAMATGEWKEGPGGRFACVIATLQDVLVGVVVSFTFNLSDAVAEGRMSYELLQSRKKDTEAVMVKVLAVDRPHRRGGLGTELLYAGVRSLAIQSPTAGAALFYAPAGHVPSSDFIESLRFTPVGFLRRYYKERNSSSSAVAGSPAAAGGGKDKSKAKEKEEQRFDAVVWAAAFHEFELEQYTNDSDENVGGTAAAAAAAAAKKSKKDGEGDEEEEEEDYGGLVDLADPALPSKRVKRMPKWAKSCLLQYALPLGLVFFLFICTYLFVLYGPTSKLGLDKLITPPASVRNYEREALERAAAAHEEAPGSIGGAYNPHYGEEL